ncbi:MAG TPA: glycosyltransferase [Jatrophihabitantaceae bacterium]
MTLDFSVLLPVYARNRPDELRAAVLSTVDDQTRRPGELVLVRDGIVPPELQETIDDLIEKSPVTVTYVPLDHNVGLAAALDRGLAASANDVIARMDADDVSVATRFEKQLPLIEEGADIVGSGLMEFVGTIDNVVQVRVPPVDPAWIRSAYRFRDPFNHPTVVYRRTAVQAVGGYQDMHLMEDYLLFARMLAAGANPANLAEPLVYYRVSDGAYARRGGRAVLRAELDLQRRLRADGITTRGQYLRNVFVRGGYRLVPEALRKRAYRALIAHRGFGDDAVMQGTKR